MPPEVGLRWRSKRVGDVTSEGKIFATQGVFGLPVYLSAVLALFGLLPQHNNPGLRWSFWGVALCLLIWQLVLSRRATVSHRTTEICVRLSPSHYVQAVVHLCIYAYWGWYWHIVYDQAFLILAQLVFAYLFDMLLCWSRRDRWHLSFGQFPIVLSMNLFLLFRPDWFILQFAMIAVSQLGKEFIRREEEGVSRHIFNPSGFSLALFSIGLLMTGNSSLTWGEEIANTLFHPGHIYLAIFLLGLVVQHYFSVTLITVSAVIVLYVLNGLYTGFTSVYYFSNSGIPIAVFIGLHLLVTDPATSPRTAAGRVLFGAVYGAGVFVAYGALELLGAPTFYDKLLCVPFLNLAVQGFDRWGRRFAVAVTGSTAASLPNAEQAVRLLRSNRIHMASWALLFALLHTTGFIGKGHDGERLDFWRQACGEGLRNGCRNLTAMLATQCNQQVDSACAELVQRVSARELEWRKQCAAGSSEGCELLVTVLADRCNRGTAAACLELGDMLQAGVVVKRAPAMAAEFLSQACDLGAVDGCKSLAGLLLSGREATVDPARTAIVLSKACELGDAASCALGGHMYENGKGVAVDLEKARVMIGRACDGGLQEACARLSRQGVR